MRKAEITLFTVLYFIVTTLVGAYIEKEYGLTLTIEKSFKAEEVKVKPYPDIIITDK